MEWHIAVNEEYQYVEIATSGVADKRGSLDMAKAIATVLREHKINRALIDHRNIDSVSGGTLEVYHRPEQFPEIGVIRGIKIAEIVKPEHQEFFKFLEVVCVNRGYEFSVFHDQEAALAWLLNS
ncbi:MAG: hypothetical protein JXB30_11210 [Anaerolineae bacterium]|nr:hypothetical protein [Anaerolineae bacterium]